MEKTRTIFHEKMSDLMEFKPEIDELDIEEFTCNSPDELSEVEDIKPTIEDIEVQNQDNNSTENQTRVVSEPIEEDPINKQSNEISELKLEVQQFLQNQKVILARLAQIITQQESLVTIVTGNNDMLKKNYKMIDLMEFKAEIDELDIEEFTCNSPSELSEVEDIKPLIEDIEIQNQDNNSTENQTRVVIEPIEENPTNKQRNEISELKLEVQKLLENQKVILARLAQIITHQESLVTIVTGNNDMLQKNYKMFFKKPYVLSFPLKTDYDLKEINEILKSEKRENTITLMSNMLAVGDLQGNFSKIMDANLIMRYNYDGSKSKCALRSYGALIDALFEVTYKYGRKKKDKVIELRKVFKTLKNRIHKQESRKKYRKDEDSYECTFLRGHNDDNCPHRELKLTRSEHPLTY